MPLHPTVSTKPPRQLAISLDRPVLNGMTSSDRNAAVRAHETRVTIRNLQTVQAYVAVRRAPYRELLLAFKGPARQQLRLRAGGRLRRRH